MKKTLITTVAVLLGMAAAAQNSMAYLRYASPSIR